MDYMIRSTASAEDFVKKATDTLVTYIDLCIGKYGHCILGLAGGNTPKPIYTALGKADVDWSNVSIFLTDERYIDAEDADSNQNMVRETLLKNAKIPEENIVFPDTSLPIDECMSDYEVRLATLLSKGIPHIVTLGMGDDGHITSLFPPLEDAAFGDHLVIHTQTDQFAVKDRISTTMVVLLSAQVKLFLLSGKSKKVMWEEMETAEFDPYRYPAQAVLKIGGAEVITQW